MADDSQEISALPTKAFFVDMFTKDIPLPQAVLDLVDNSVDGAKRTANGGPRSFEGKIIEVTFSRERFRIWDNCGGFDKQTARDYAFRFGRPKEAKQVSGSIGQFGVGMKRALFKFGKHFVVQSATKTEEWGVEVPVEDWQKDDDDWHFPWKKDFNPQAPISTERPGTEIVVTSLRYSVGNTFATDWFKNQIVSLIKSKHRQFISQGLSIKVNGEQIPPLELVLISDDDVHPAVWNNIFRDKGEKDVTVRVIAGVGTSAPRLAGWYVICNGRMILDADRRDVTGWGVVEEATSKTVVPGYHNQFARFRGIATFDCEDSGRLPWNTTKTDVDQDNEIWRQVLERMMELMRPVIDFLNELDADIEEHTRERSPLFQLLSEAAQVGFETLTKDAVFAAPEREDLPDVVRFTKIQYSREVDDIDFLKRALKVGSAKAVGERTFDLALQKQRGQ